MAQKRMKMKVNIFENAILLRNNLLETLFLNLLVVKTITLNSNYFSF